MQPSHHRWLTDWCGTVQETRMVVKSNNESIPLDLHNEHLNCVFKDDINTFCANISESSVARSSQAIGQRYVTEEH